jgi:hypothetical protein
MKAMQTAGFGVPDGFVKLLSRNLPAQGGKAENLVAGPILIHHIHIGFLNT